MTFRLLCLLGFLLANVKFVTGHLESNVYALLFIYLLKSETAGCVNEFLVL